MTGDKYCKLCGCVLSKDIFISNLVKHHISYSPEKTIVVCRYCHRKIHYSDKYPDLKPKDERGKRKKKYVLVPCKRCKGKAEMKVEEYNRLKRRGVKEIKKLCVKCEMMVRIESRVKIREGIMDLSDEIIAHKNKYNEDMGNKIIKYLKEKLALNR